MIATVIYCSTGTVLSFTRRTRRTTLSLPPSRHAAGPCPPLGPAAFPHPRAFRPGATAFSSTANLAAGKPWSEPMPASQFEDMREILKAPSPVGLEAAMTEGVLSKAWQRHVDAHGWKIHRFKGNSSVVLDTHPDAGDDMLKVMFVGHADKIRMESGMSLRMARSM